MKHRYFIISFGIIFLLCALLMLSPARDTGSLKIAEIYTSGELIYEIDLSHVSAPYEIPIKNGRGENIVLVEQDGISIAEANCPDKLCVRQGTLSGGSVPIVCLPNELSIKIRSANTSSETDAISR